MHLVHVPPVRRSRAKKSRHRLRRRIEGHHHCHRHQTEGPASSLRFLRLPAGRQMSTRSTGRTFHMKTNKRSLHGSTSFLLVIWMGLCLPIHPPHPSPKGVQAITHPRRHRHHDPRRHFLLAQLAPEQARSRDPTPRTKLPRFWLLPRQLDAGIYLPCCRNMDPYVPNSRISYCHRSLLR